MAQTQPLCHEVVTNQFEGAFGKEVGRDIEVAGVFRA
jgi:hypothetical protein